MKTVITIVLAFVTLQTFATAQYSDKIIYNGKKYELHANPLETYFEKFPDKRPKGGAFSTALWRGYVATFEVVENQLFLNKIEVRVLQPTTGKASEAVIKNVISEVFPNQDMVKVDWLTGILVLPYGRLMNYVHMGYGSTYKKYVLLEFNDGNLINEKRFNYKLYEDFKERQFQAFKQTDEYHKIKERLRMEGNTDDFIDSFLRSFVTSYTTKLLTE